MRGIIQRVSRFKYKLALGGLLVTAYVISLLLVLIQTIYNGSYIYGFLVFNLGLAWIPWVAAVITYLAMRNRNTFSW